MTTGEKLVELSSLTTGTAMEHLLHITTGVADAPSISVLDIVGESAIGSNDGSIGITAISGATPYEYSIGGDYQTGNTFTGLAGGVFAVSVRDASGYTDSISGITVPTAGSSNKPVITEILTGDATSSTKKDGSITVIAGGGVTPYEYSLNNGEYQDSNVFNKLGVGSYTITVKGANGVTTKLSGIKVGSQSSSTGGGYGRGRERRSYVKVDVKNVKTKDMEDKKEKKIKINVTV